MDELLRYLWMHGTECMASELLVYTIMLLVAVGSVMRSRILRVRDLDGMVAAIVVAFVFNSMLLAAALLPASPLLGVTGRIYPSPWASGLFVSLCLECILVSLVFGLVSGTVHSWRGALELVTHGISRWPWAILLAMIVSFIFDVSY